MPGRSNHKLQSLLQEYCPMASLSAHNALDDCSALHQVLKEVVKQQLTDGEGNTADIEQTLWTQLMTSYFAIEYSERVLNKVKL